MKKYLITIALLLALVCTLPLSVMAESTGEVSSESRPLCVCDEASASAYCPTCGGVNSAFEDDRWNCPTCGRTDNLTPFCPQCGEKHPDTDRFWSCSTCEQENNFYETCNRCGASRPSASGGAKFHIDWSSLGETLPIMGMGMLGIFLVIGTIALSVTVLRKLPEKSDE